MVEYNQSCQNSTGVILPKRNRLKAIQSNRFVGRVIFQITCLNLCFQSHSETLKDECFRPSCGGKIFRGTCGLDILQITSCYNIWEQYVQIKIRLLSYLTYSRKEYASGHDAIINGKMHQNIRCESKFIKGKLLSWQTENFAQGVHIL